MNLAHVDSGSTFSLARCIHLRNKWKQEPTINYVLLISEGLTSLTVIQNQLAAQILSGTVIKLFFLNNSQKIRQT